MSRSHTPIVVLAFAFAILSGCDKMALVSPTGSTITLSINKTSVPINGTAEITASVIESSGTPVQNGTVVTFTSSFGTIDPRDARTDGGKARVTFTGTQSGIAKIGAFSGGAKTAADLEVKVGGAAAETLRVRAEPPTVPQTGGSAQIIVTVSDISGTALPGAPVVFTTDNGSLSPGSSITDANGEARTTLTTTRTAKVTATVASKTDSVTVSVVNAPTVAVTGPATATAGLPANFEIAPVVPVGGAPIREVTVNWGDGSSPQSLGAISSKTTVSHTFARADSYIVSATATDQTGQQGTGSFSINVARVLPTITIDCPGTTQVVGALGTYTVTPPTNPPFAIQNVTVELGDGTSRNLGQITGRTSFTHAYGAEGGFTVTAIATDTSGQRGTSSCAVVVSRATPPTITFTQTSDTTTPATPANPESFSVSATAASGLSIRSIVVTRQSNGSELYRGSGGGTFAASVTANEVLNATATDSAGNTSTSQLVVK